LKQYNSSIGSDYKRMFSVPEFRRSIDAATNTPALFKQRIGMTRALLLNATGSE